MLLRNASLSLLVASSAFAAPGWTPERALKTKRVTGVTVSPDGQRVAYVVASAVMEGEKSEWLSQIHLAKSDGSGAFQLTRGEKSATGPAWSPTEGGSRSCRPAAARATSGASPWTAVRPSS